MKISSIGVLSSSKPISYKSNLRQFPDHRVNRATESYTKGNTATMFQPQLDTLKSSLTIFQRGAQKAKEAQKFYSQALWELAYGLENDMKTVRPDENTLEQTIYDKFGTVYLIRRYDEQGKEKDFIQISDPCTYILTRNKDNEYEEYVFKGSNLVSLSTNVIVDRVTDKKFDERFIYNEDGSLQKYETN